MPHTRAGDPAVNSLLSARGVPLRLTVLCGLLWLGPAHGRRRADGVVDGMKPRDALDADAHRLKLPLPRSLVRDGSDARGVRGVRGVWPTITYPGHTTLITGVAPAEHGITSNLEFDPRRTFGESWFWYAAHPC